jgi:hypothetical protein
MYPKTKGNKEIAYLKIEKAFDEALAAEVDTDELLSYLSYRAIHKKDYHTHPTATKQSAFEPQSKSQPQTESPLVHDSLQAEHSQPQKNNGGNQERLDGPGQAPSNNPEENRPFPEGIQSEAAVATHQNLSETHCLATPECEAVNRLLEYARQTVCSVCSQNDTPALLPRKEHQVSYPECFQTTQTFHQDIKYYRPCPILQTILSLSGNGGLSNDEQGKGRDQT